MIRWLLAIVLLLIGGAAWAQTQTKQHSLDEIAKAWKRRQEKFRVARVEWSEKQRTPAGLLSFIWDKIVGGPHGKDMNPDGLTVPPKDVEHTIEGKLEIEGAKVSLYTTGFDWDRARKDYVPSPRQTVTDGVIEKRLDPKGTLGRDWPLGSIWKRAVFGRATEPGMRPLFWFLRGTDPVFRSFRINELTVTNREVKIDGVACVELDEVIGRRVLGKVWLAHERDYVVVRETALSGGKLIQQITIQYRQDPGLGWVPSGWQRTTSYAQGKYVEQATAEVTHFSTPPSFPAKTFSLDFPPGTRVSDETLPRSEQDYIVRPQGGGKRVMQPADYGKTYHEILATSNSSNTRSAGLGVAWWLLYGSLFLAALAAGAFLVRKIVRGRQQG